MLFKKQSFSLRTASLADGFSSNNIYALAEDRVVQISMWLYLPARICSSEFRDCKHFCSSLLLRLVSARFKGVEAGSLRGRHCLLLWD